MYYTISDYHPPPTPQISWRIVSFFLIFTLPIGYILFVVLMPQKGYCLIQGTPLFLNNSVLHEIEFIANFNPGCNSTITAQHEEYIFKYTTNDPQISNEIYEYLIMQKLPFYCIKSKFAQNIPLPPQKCLKTN